MRYPKEYLDELVFRADIVEVVRTFVRLRTRGSTNQEHIGLCPFYEEKTPSFVVHTRWQFYHCFGCGVHGSVIKFLMEHQKMNFQQAVIWLAKRYRFYHKEWERQKRRSQRRLPNE